MFSTWPVLGVIVAVVVALVIHMWSTLAARTAAPVVRGDVLLVFAHPDDEAMFFAPLLTSLRRLNVRFHFLCLSSGNADGLGKVRSKELTASAKYFGAATCKIIDDPSLPDGMLQSWDKAVVARTVRQTLDVLGTVRTVVTFDSRGVSGHANHVDTWRGVLHLKEMSPPGIIFLSLQTYPVLLKYSSVLSLLPFTLGLKKLPKSPPAFVVLTPPPQLFRAYGGMQCHRSQFVWFRYLFVALSSYSLVNEFVVLHS